MIANAFTWESKYNYNYQNYPVHFNDLFHGPGPDQGPFGGDSIMNNQLIKSAMRSLINPAKSPGAHKGLGPNASFRNQWNKELGYSFLNHSAGQENIGCRARCLKMEESPVCGSNMTRYYNSCDAECDQVTYGTSMLRYNNMCCCDEDSLSLKIGHLHCIVKSGFNKNNNRPKLIVNKCMYQCLEKKGESLVQENYTAIPC